MVSNAVVDEARKEASQTAITLQRHYADLQVLPRVIDQRRASVAEAEALAAKARIDFDQTRVKAPFSGRVIKTLVAPGDRSLPGMPLIQVANYDNLEIRTSIPSDLGHKIRASHDKGTVVSAVGELDNETIHMTLDRLSGDVKTGQSGLDAFFTTDDNTRLDIGRVVNLHITLPSESQVVALPVQSIYERGRIYRVNGERLEGINVEQVGDYIGSDGSYQILVRSTEIAAGDRIITTQLPRAITGLLVDPIESVNLNEAIAGDVPVSKES